MQNFTLGRKGLNWLLFAFILFVGSSSSYGQCADVNDENADANDGNQQSYCYLSTVQDLLEQGTNDGDPNTAPANIEIYETADSTNDTDPFDRDELLTNNTTYYFGDSTDSSCARAAVIVSITAAPTPQNTITNGRDSFTISPCESSGYTAGQLEDLFIPDGSYQIEVYSDEFGTTAMSDTEQLTPGGSYFVGQIDPNGTDCPSTRAAVGFDPLDAPAPNVEPLQTFCDGATVADLEETTVGPNVQAVRWYRSIDSNTPLDDDEELVDGQDYFAAQVVNERNSPFPPCETPMADRAEVVVTLITFDAGDDVTGEICADDLQALIDANANSPESIIFSFVDDGRTFDDLDVEFDPSLQALATQFAQAQESPTNGATNLFTTATFTTTDGNSCTDDVIFDITVNESFNAGDSNTEGNIVCRAFFTEPTATEAEVEAYLRSLFNDAEGDEIDSDGNFSSEDITTITKSINDGLEGPFTTTYTVGEGLPCEDSATFTFEVDQADDLGTQTGDGIYCQSDIDERIASGPASNSFYRALARQLFLEQLDSGVPQDGTFIDSTLPQVVTAYGQGTRTFSTTYSITTENGCTASVDISFDIIEDTNAGDSNLTDNTACRSEFSATATDTEVENYLASLLSDDADTDGDFSDLSTIATGITSGNNGPFTSTYTTGAGTACSDTSEFEFSVVDDIAPNAGSYDSETICENDLPLNLFTLINNDSAAMTTGSFSGVGVTDNVFNPASVASVETYSITYTVVADPENCITGPESSTTFDITVDPAPISATISRELCVLEASTLISDQSYEYVVGILAEAGLTTVDPDNFTGSPFVEAQNLADFIENPTSDSETFTFNYTTLSDNTCEDGNIEINITINNSEDAFAGNIEPQTVCFDAGMVNLNDFLIGSGATTGGTFSGTSVSENMFDASVGAGTYTISYSVNDTSDDCVTPGTEDETDFELTVDLGRELGPIIERSICNADINPFISLEEVETYYTGLLGDNFSPEGTFTPLLSELFNDYQNDPIQTFETEYSLGTGDCADSVILSVEVTPTVDAEAGDIDPQTVCFDAGMVDLSDFLIGSGATTGGTFSGTSVSENMFDASVGEGTYTITYNVNDTSNDCVTPGTDDETEFNLTVDLGRELGPIIERTLCYESIDPFLNVEDVEDYFADLLGDNFSSEGTFSPLLSELFDDYQDDPIQTFTTEYSLGSGDCEDSVTIEVKINDTEAAEAGDIEPQTVCSNEGMVDLNDFLAGSGATPGGTFSGPSVNDNMFDSSIGSNTDGYEITYTVGDDLPCVAEGTVDSETFVITINDAPNAGPGGEFSFCQDEFEAIIAQVIANPSGEGIELLNELDSTITAGGDFSNDTLSELLIQYANLTEYPITFTTTYTVSNGDCTASADYSITVNPLEAANAGIIENDTVCSDSGMIDLSIYLEGSGANSGGTFSGEGVTDNMFDTSLGSNEAGYVITYSVDDTSSDCILEDTSDSEDFTIFVEDSFTISAETEREQICKDNISNLFPSSTAQTTVRNFYLNMLEEDVPTDGEFNPTISQLINRYNTVTKLGDFTTEYTVTSGECSASVELTIEITDTEPAVIGTIPDPAPICQNADEVDLFSYLPEDANPNGTFDGYEDGMFNPGMEGEGPIDITYRLTDDSPCTTGEATATFTITVTDAAYAGMDITVPAACSNDADIDLNTSIGVDADTDGEFTFEETGEVIADGILDLSGLAAQDYRIVYTVAAINDCGDDTAILTVTVSEAPDAPTVDGDPFNFCANNAPTGSDLSATGSNLTFYSDEELSTMVMADEALSTGTYYVTQRVEEGGCESNATAFTVNVNDTDTPTISSTTQEFCEFDDATIADLTDLIEETGTITWYDSADGDNALSSGTSLQDGVSYYATLFNVDSGCESSVRLQVTVSINDDCPLLIPDGLSPNGDGLNDTFEIENIRDKYPNFTMEIRNRFGDVVYKGNTNTPDWNGFSTEGSFGNDVLPVGAYFYLLNYNDGSTPPVRGTVYLSR